MTRNQAVQAAEDSTKFAMYHVDEELANYNVPALEHLRKLRRVKETNITLYFV